MVNAWYALDRATRNLPALVMERMARDRAMESNKKFAGMLAGGDTAGALKFALESGNADFAAFASSREKAARAQREAGLSRFAHTLYNMTETEDFAGLDRAVARYGSTPEGQAELQKALFLEPHRQVRGLSVVRDPEGTVRLSPRIYNEQLGSEGVMTGGKTADPGDSVISQTLDQFKASLQPLLEKDPYEAATADGDYDFKVVGDRLVKINNETAEHEVLSFGDDDDGFDDVVKGILRGVSSIHGEEIVGDPDTVSLIENAAYGIARDLGAESEGDGAAIAAALDITFRRYPELMAALQSGYQEGNRETARAAAIRVEEEVMALLGSDIGGKGPPASEAAPKEDSERSWWNPRGW